MTIGERIKQVRKSKDLTQQKFADSLGMKQNTVATYEMGRTNPSDPAIKSICREFGVNEEWLRTGVGEMFVPASDSPLDALADEKKLSQNERLLLERFLNLSPEARQGILSYITGIAAALASGESQEPTSVSVKEAEDDYIKKVSNFAQKMEFSASNTTNDIKTDEKHA